MIRETIRRGICYVDGGRESDGVEKFFAKLTNIFLRRF